MGSADVMVTILPRFDQGRAPNSIMGPVLFDRALTKAGRLAPRQFGLRASSNRVAMIWSSMLPVTDNSSVEPLPDRCQIFLGSMRMLEPSTAYQNSCGFSCESPLLEPSV